MIWSSATKHRLQKIHRMQNRAVRNVLNARFNAPSTPIYKQLGIPKFNDIAKIQMCKLMYSYNIGSIPESMKSLFVRNSSIHSYNTRHSNEPHVVARRTSSISKTFIHQAPKLWLDLPLQMRNINSINYFSSKVKKYYISVY